MERGSRSRKLALEESSKDDGGMRGRRWSKGLSERVLLSGCSRWACLSVAHEHPLLEARLLSWCGACQRSTRLDSTRRTHARTSARMHLCLSHFACARRTNDSIWTRRVDSRLLFVRFSAFELLFNRDYSAFAFFLRAPPLATRREATRV